MSKQSSSKIPTFSQDPNYGETEFVEDDSVTWRQVILQGALTGFVVFSLITVSFVILIVLGWGALLSIIDIIYATAAMFFWVASFSVIWFGPSPSLAWIKSKVLGLKSEPIDTITSMKQGAKRFTSGVVLFVAYLVFIDLLTRNL